jgi:hypothetical protein
MATNSLIDEPHDLRAAVTAAPESAAAALIAAMAREPAQRPGACAEVVRELASAYSEAAAAPGSAAEAEPDHGEQPGSEAPRHDGAPVAAGEPAETEEGKRPRRRGVAALTGTGAIVVAGVVAAVLVLQPFSGGSSPGAHGRRPAAVGTGSATPSTYSSAGSPSVSRRSSTPSPSPSASSTSASSPSVSSSVASSPSASMTAGATGLARSPVKATTALYALAARNDYQPAWALAAPSLRRQFGSYGRFTATFRTLLSIDFQRAEVTSRSPGAATVAIRTTARHTDHTDHCTGDVLTRATRNGWQVAHLSIAC